MQSPQAAGHLYAPVQRAPKAPPPTPQNHLQQLVQPQPAGQPRGLPSLTWVSDQNYQLAVQQTPQPPGPPMQQAPPGPAPLSDPREDRRQGHPPPPTFFWKLPPAQSTTRQQQQVQGGQAPLQAAGSPSAGSCASLPDLQLDQWPLTAELQTDLQDPPTPRPPASPSQPALYHPATQQRMLQPPDLAAGSDVPSYAAPSSARPSAIPQPLAGYDLVKIMDSDWVYPIVRLKYPHPEHLHFSISPLGHRNRYGLPPEHS